MRWCEGWQRCRGNPLKVAVYASCGPCRCPPPVQHVGRGERRDIPVQREQAIEAWNYAEGEAASVHFGHVAFDAGTLYRVRFHVRADAAENGKGEAFCCKFGGKTIAPRIEEMKQGWQWYEFAPRKLNEDFVLSFASGRFANGGGTPAVKGVRIDMVEIARVQEPVKNPK